MAEQRADTKGAARPDLPGDRDPSLVPVGVERLPTAGPPADWGWGPAIGPAPPWPAELAGRRLASRRTGGHERTAGIAVAVLTVATLAHLVVLVSWWWLVPGLGGGPGFGVLALGATLVLADLVAVFALGAARDTRPTSRCYLAAATPEVASRRS